VTSTLAIGHWTSSDFQSAIGIATLDSGVQIIVAEADRISKKFQAWTNDTSGSGLIYTVSGPLMEMFGFPSAGAKLANDGATITTTLASFLPNFDYPSEVYIRCPQLSSSFLVIDSEGNGGQSEIFAVVPMTVAFGEHMQYEPRYHVQQYYGGYKALSVLDFQFLDCKGQPLPFLGQSWHMTLRIYFTFDY